METKKTKERKSFMGLVEMNESLKKDVSGGIFFLPEIFTPCCGMVILTDPGVGFPRPDIWF